MEHSLPEGVAMTKDELEALAFTVRTVKASKMGMIGSASDVVTFADALAYGASEREAGEMAGLEIAKRAICSHCGSGEAVEIDNNEWMHPNCAQSFPVNCYAGAIHNELNNHRKIKAYD
jgi:hypothetical protein